MNPVYGSLVETCHRTPADGLPTSNCFELQSAASFTFSFTFKLQCSPSFTRPPSFKLLSSYRLTRTLSCSSSIRSPVLLLVSDLYLYPYTRTTIPFIISKYPHRRTAVVDFFSYTPFLELEYLSICTCTPAFDLQSTPSSLPPLVFVD